MPTLSGDEIVQWQEAGVALAAVNAQLGTIADNKQKYADYEVSTQGDAFVQSMVKVVESEKAAIDNANALAKAAGFAGASTKDLTTILNSGSAQITAAVASLATSIWSNIAALYGSATSSKANGGYDGMFEVSQSAAANQAAAAQKQAEASGTALDTIEELGEYAFASGARRARS